MEVKKAVMQLQQSDEFKEFKKENSDYYLCHCFIMMETSKDMLWQIGYTNKKSELVNTFAISKDYIKDQGKEKVFKQPDTTIDELNLSMVEIDYGEVLKKASLFQQDKYPNERPVKIIAILQNFNNNQIWNITFVTETFKTLNMKFDAKSSELNSHSLKNLVGLPGND